MHGKRYTITVLDEETDDKEVFETDDLTLMTFENGESDEYLFEFQFLNYELAVRKLAEETQKVRSMGTKVN